MIYTCILDTYHTYIYSSAILQHIVLVYKIIRNMPIHTTRKFTIELRKIFLSPWKNSIREYFLDASNGSWDSSSRPLPKDLGMLVCVCSPGKEEKLVKDLFLSNEVYINSLLENVIGFTFQIVCLWVSVLGQSLKLQWKGCLSLAQLLNHYLHRWIYSVQIMNSGVLLMLSHQRKQSFIHSFNESKLTVLWWK
jgi:hypothetical protein